MGEDLFGEMQGYDIIIGALGEIEFLSSEKFRLCSIIASLVTKINPLGMD